jgi:radical SAM-linked protein
LDQDLTTKAAHLRLWYRKQDLAAYLSQLELQAVFERAMRRARIPLAFSRGYHPLPLLSFARALPVGVRSNAEYLDVFLRRDMDPDAVVEALRGQLPMGLECFAAEPLGMGRKQPQAVAEDFCMTLHAAPERTAEALGHWREFARLDSFTWTRETRKGTRERDIRPLFTRVEIQEQGPDGACVRLRLDWSEVYLNPLAMVRAVCPGLELTDFTLSKERQTFAAPDHAA